MQAITSRNDKNNYSVSELNYIRETIENMNKFNQIEILKIFSKYEKVILNEKIWLCRRLKIIPLFLNFMIIFFYGYNVFY